MGLLQRVSESGIEQKNESLPVSEEKIQTKSNSVGLLKKTMLLSQKNRLDFFEFTAKYQINHCSLLYCKDDVFAIKDSVDYDAIAICNSISTKDFWDGTIPEENTSYIFGDEVKQLPFNQFLSPSLKKNITQLFIFKISADKIFMWWNYDSSIVENSSFIDELICLKDSDISTKINTMLPSGSNAFLYKLNISKVLKEIIRIQNKENYSDILLKSISTVIYNSLQKFFPYPSCIILDKNYNFRLSLILPETIPDSLLLNHLISNFKPILNFNAELISILFVDKAESDKQILTFLLAE